MEDKEQGYRLFDIGLCDGIHIEYPDTWKIARVTQRVYVFLPQGKELSERYTSKSAIMIVSENLKEKLNGEVTFPKYVDMMTKSLKEDALRVVDGYETGIGPDGKEGHYWRYDFTESEFIDEYVMLDGDTLYTVQLTTGSAKDREELGPLLKHMASTFKLVRRTGLKFAYLAPHDIVWEACRENGAKLDTYMQVTSYLPSQRSPFWKRHSDDAKGNRIVMKSTLVDDLVLSFKVGKTGLPAETFIETLHGQLSKDSIAQSVVKTTVAKEDTEHATLGLPDYKHTAVRFQTKFQTTKQDDKDTAKTYSSETIIVIVEDTYIQFGISALEGEMHRYHPLFNAIYSSLRLKEVARENEIKADTRVGSLAQYNLYCNLMSNFSVLIPIQLNISEHSGHNNLIFVSTKDSSHIAEISVERLPFDDPTSTVPISLIEYHNDTKLLFSSQLQSMKMINEKPARMGKYKAASMLFDSAVRVGSPNPNVMSEIEIERYLVKLAVMQGNIGVKISMKSLQDKFQDSYDTSNK
ncbi:hypothetical protein DFA_01478 [Cavenderia fasciculata]|uniref:Uncharacterized protein n=1 Tax=Cavenderia fasciculata TaxID=261658 RepID=F4PT16_CACFS|nr:uncharacterized protein DFA_01478 [Cavenderia fasciculata]EGG21592.1 hypothetical protein DFA_01478 [Cavenderia fasciculata]|eukprot:XP_004359442.1 hypothetical protein DFA_01478 [Cavenderia fasciculata]